MYNVTKLLFKRDSCEEIYWNIFHHFGKKKGYKDPNKWFIFKKNKNRPFFKRQTQNAFVLL